MGAILSTNAPIDLNDVELFVHVVQAARFSAAAAARGVPVSTVSRRIARLEARLGTRLLERTTRRLRLTDVGRAFFDHAERAVDEISQGSHHVRAVGLEPRGRIRITAPIGFGARLGDALAPYLAARPQVSIDLDLSDRQVDLVAEGVDIAIRSGRVDTPDFAAKKLSDLRRYLFASSAYLARRGRPRTLADLPSHDLLATRGTPNHAVWELVRDRPGVNRPRSRHRFTFSPRFLVNDLVAARAAARAGMGIAMLPRFDIDGLVRVLPTFAGEKGGLWLLYPARRSLTAAVRSCVDHLLDALVTK